MAIPAQSGDFVLQVANVGKDVVTSFTKFIASRKIQERHLENILASVSITTSLLLELGTIINQQEKYVEILDAVTRPTCEICRADFDKLLVLSRESSESGMWIREGKLGGKPVAAEVDPWFLFNIGLGGQEKAGEFWRRIEATRYKVVALSDTVKYKIFRELETKELLNSEQNEELKNLTALLPQLVKSIERSEQDKKTRLVKAAERTERAANLVNEAGSKSSVGNDAASDITMIEKDNESINIRTVRPDVYPDVDRHSIYSRNSLDSERQVNQSFPWSHSSKVTRDIPLDPKEIYEVYEEWSLKWTEPRRDIRESCSFFGLKVKVFNEDPGFWDVDPEHRTQEELITAYESSNMSGLEYRAGVDKIMSNLPEDAYQCIETLLEDRERSSPQDKYRRQFSVVAVRPKTRNHLKARRFFRSAKPQEWLIMIKGETLDKQDTGYRPNRCDDPWLAHKRGQIMSHGVRSPRRSYSPPPPFERPALHVTDHYNPSLRRCVRPIQIRSPSPMPYAHLEDRRHRQVSGDSESAGFKPGTIVVSEISDTEEVEKRMQEILADLPAKFSN